MEGHRCFVARSHLLDRQEKKKLVVLSIRPTGGVRQAPDLLTVDVSLVPHQPVHQAGPGGVPALIQPPLHRGADVHLGQAAQRGDGGHRGGRREEDPQQGEVARSTGAQIAEPHEGSGDCDIFLHSLRANERGAE